MSRHKSEKFGNYGTVVLIVCVHKHGNGNKYDLYHRGYTWGVR